MSVHLNSLLSTPPKLSTNRNSYIAITKTVVTSGNEQYPIGKLVRTSEIYTLYNKYKIL